MRRGAAAREPEQRSLLVRTYPPVIRRPTPAPDRMRVGSTCYVDASRAIRRAWDLSGILMPGHCDPDPVGGDAP